MRCETRGKPRGMPTPGILPVGVAVLDAKVYGGDRAHHDIGSHALTGVKHDSGGGRRIFGGGVKRHGVGNIQLLALLGHASRVAGISRISSRARNTWRTTDAPRQPQNRFRGRGGQTDSVRGRR